MTRLLLQGIVCLFLCVSLNTYKPFYCEILLRSLKNNPSSQAELFSLEPEASVAELVDDEVVSVGDEASSGEAVAKSDK